MPHVQVESGTMVVAPDAPLLELELDDELEDELDDEELHHPDVEELDDEVHHCAWAFEMVMPVTSRHMIAKAERV